MYLFGYPIFGFFLPFIGRRQIALNRDGSQVDTGEAGICDEVGPYFVRPLVFEWLGYGRPLTASMVYETRSGEIVNPPWLAEVA